MRSSLSAPFCVPNLWTGGLGSDLLTSVPQQHSVRWCGQMEWWVCTFSQPAWKDLPKWTARISEWLRSKGLLLTLAVADPPQVVTVNHAASTQTNIAVITTQPWWRRCQRAGPLGGKPRRPGSSLLPTLDLHTWTASYNRHLISLVCHNWRQVARIQYCPNPHTVWAWGFWLI